MGLPMDHNLSEIHVPSGPSSFRTGDASLDTLPLLDLIKRKDNVESELKALGSVLDSHGVDMQTSLTDREGFPRSDIDVAQVRTTRARIIALKNDWKDLMDRIEKGLHEHHANLQASGGIKDSTPSSSASPLTNGTSAAEPLRPPFAKVNSVEGSSPAQEAGLKPGDQIRSFGAANSTNHNGLRRVGEIVQQNLGRQILVKVLRSTGAESQELSLQLTPRQGWGGRGTLGCHILPV